MERGGVKLFRLDIKWLEEMEVVEVIKTTWHNTIFIGSLDFQLHKKLFNIKHKLIVWKKDNNFNVQSKIDEVLYEIEALDQHVQSIGVLTEELMGERNSKLKSLHNLRRVEELYWKQISRTKWLKESNMNTKFFHSIASTRRRKNDISGLTIPGIDADDSVKMEGAIIDHFKKAFSIKVKFTPKLEKVPFKVLTVDMSSNLECNISMEELEGVVFALLSDKALDPDGFPHSFFHRFWNLIKSELLEMVRALTTRGEIFKWVNATYIALILKKSVIAELSNIWLINLLTSLYKIMEKVLIEVSLTFLISNIQSAFILE
ncbi:uncharacterized protein LOC105420966 [Amborella trichopoda]|uniref:uncharacterized protein LOC105420966 n=1 Tax=Amborella trichopoda TaxID=13333 RepID=UPI0005D3407E|nr:uncharacterized protein LOC105420966 [Amborella trichopoda]|eukprot:XP_011624963.1 uncharacterized protein LOC105420966 [Amborella trichopoda]